MHIPVKICGITSLDDATVAVEAGADYIGFMLWEGSKRYIKPSDAMKIVEEVGEYVKTVGIFVNEKPKMVDDLVIGIGLDFAQLHGDETVSYISTLRTERIKAIRVKDESDIAYAATFEHAVDYILLDTYVEGERGGTGKTFNWDLAKGLAKDFPVILSGGLNSENVVEAINRVNPYGVDVSSGVEKSPGIKDHDKIRDFIKAVRSVHN